MFTTQPLWRLKNSLCEIHFFEQQILQVFLHFRVCFLSSLSQWSVDQKINACVAVSPSQLPGCSSIRTVMPDVNACFSFQLFCCCCGFLCLCDQSLELFTDLQETIGWHKKFFQNFYTPYFHHCHPFWCQTQIYLTTFTVKYHFCSGIMKLQCQEFYFNSR